MRLYRGVIEGRVDRETKNGRKRERRENEGREEKRQGKGHGRRWRRERAATG